MIIAISGKPGGGKGYESVKNFIIPTLKEGRKVVTNIPLNIEHFKAVYGQEIADLIVLVEYDFHKYGDERPFSDPEEFKQFHDWKDDKGRGVYFFIDEVHLSMPAGRTKSPVLEYLGLHRHYGVDLALITQNFRKVHRDVRDLVQLEYRCIKKSMLGKDDEYIVKVHDGIGGHVNNVYERSYEKHIYPFYKSHTQSQTGVTEATSLQTNSGAGSKFKKLAYGMFLLAGLFALASLSSDDETDVQVQDNQSVQSETPENLAQPQTQSNQPHLQQQTVQSHQPSLNRAQQMYLDYQDRAESYHPYHEVDLHIMSLSTYWDDFTKSVVKDFTIGASRNGQVMFTFPHNDLWRAGYSVEVLGDCNLRVRYFDYEDFVLCDLPIADSGSTLVTAGS